MAPVSTANPEAVHTAAWSALLEHVYARTGLALPRLELLSGERIPQPCQRLLVHSRDMTPTLEEFYRQPMRVSVLSRELQPDAYIREVVLCGQQSSRPVEYGVIRIFLGRLPATARQQVLEEKRPFGSILHGEAIPHLSWPQAFFQVEADARIATALGLPKPGALYGRRNVLLDSSRRLLAEVIEILAPCNQAIPRT